MPQISQSITINRPVNEVFRHATDFKSMDQWQPDVTATYQSEDKVRVGVMITQNRRTRLLGWRLDLNADVIGYAPNRLLEYKGILGRFPVTGRMEFESGGSTTTVKQHLNIRMGFLYGIFSPLMSAVMNQRTKRSLAALKRTLENRSTSSSTPTDFHKQL